MAASDDEPPLELADVPRRGRPRLSEADTTAPRPGSTSWPTTPRSAGEAAAATRLPLTTSAATTSYLDDRPSWAGRLLVVGFLAAVAYGAWYVYRTMNTPTVVTVKSPYLTRIGMTIDLPPGLEWRRSRKTRSKQVHADGVAYLDLLARGQDFRTDLALADDFVVVFRDHRPGFFAQADLAEGVREMPRALAAVAGTHGAQLRGTECHLDATVRAETIMVCTGEADTPIGPRGWKAGMWPIGPDDMVGVAYITDARDARPFEPLLRSLR